MQNTVTVYLNDESFAYDVHSLYQAFYPHTRISVITEQTGEADFFCGEDCPSILVGKDEIVLKQAGESQEKRISVAGLVRAEVKNRLKLLIYDALCEEAGRSLPWGTLTGIRPTKIALSKLRDSESAETIRDYMKTVYRTSDEKIDLSLRIAGREKEILEKIERQQMALAKETAGEDALVGADVHAGGYSLSDGYSLYIGIPFCPSICLYCSFSSYAIGAYESLVEDYLTALFREIDAVAQMAEGRMLTTVYIGGGTPTALSAGQLDRLLDKVETTFDMGTVLEFTVEAGRPDSLTEEKLAVIASHFNGKLRISINPQTFSQKTLDLIGRRHTTEDVIRCYEMARAAGLSHINMDLIVGLPGETIETVAESLRQAAALAPENLTVHALAIKRSSRLHEILVERAQKAKSTAAATSENEGAAAASGNEGAFATSGNEGAAEAEGSDFSIDGWRSYLYAHGDEVMAMVHAAAADMGMEPYYLYRQKNIAGNLENVGFSRPGCEGLYNILIMEEVQDIVALGAGAACKCLVRDEDGRPLPKAKIRRCENVKNVEEYILRVDEMIERKRKLYFGST